MGIFGIFGSKSGSTSFKQRTEVFWDWCSTNSKTIYAMVDQGQIQDVAGLLSPKIEELGPGFGWVFGPGNDGGHSLTLSPEGMVSHQFLTNFWRDQAPRLEGWTFHAARQRTAEVANFAIQVGGKKLTVGEVLVQAAPDEEDRSVDISAWHPLFEQLPEQDRYQILFLLLDEVMGEHGTSGMIGAIEVSEQEPADAIPLPNLYSFSEQLFLGNNWEPAVPAETHSLMTLEGLEGEFLRSDVFTINSLYPQLVIDYLENGGNIDDPVVENGARFVFLDIPASFFPQGQEAHARGEIEDELSERLSQARAGQLIGGSAGRISMYSDFILFDVEAGLDIIKDAMNDLQLPAGSSLHFFGGDGP